jgi:GNAT superfamily N-acetyltransferase
MCGEARPFLGLLPMDIRLLDPADDAALHRFWEIGKAADNASRPYDFFAPWETARAAYRHGRPGFRDALIGAFDGPLMVGAAFLRLPEMDNRHLGFADVYVDPAHQRRGVGRALVGHLEARVRDEGRRSLLSEAYSPVDVDGPPLLFAAALGYSPAIEDGMKVVDLVATEPTWDALEAETAPRARDYRLVHWHDRVPDEHVEGYCRLNRAFNELAPSGELDLEAETWDEERVRGTEESGRRAGRHVIAVAAVDATGAMAGVTEAVVSEHDASRGFQSGTLVLPEHRGRALGLAMKLANHRAVRRLYPECRLLVTGNADVNVAMNAVNDRLGYRQVERCVEVKKNLR